MKKAFLPLMAAIAMLLVLSSCKKDDPVLGAYVEVTVTNAVVVPRGNVTVYMFKDHEPDIDTPKSDAKKSVVTNADGIAEFSINFYDLDIIEGQTNLYFAVYYEVVGSEAIFNSQGVTIRNGDSKDITIVKLL